jgi:hypothetical protein
MIRLLFPPTELAYCISAVAGRMWHSMLKPQSLKDYSLAHRNVPSPDAHDLLGAALDKRNFLRLGVCLKLFQNEPQPSQQFVIGHDVCNVLVVTASYFEITQLCVRKALLPPHDDHATRIRDLDLKIRRQLVPHSLAQSRLAPRPPTVKMAKIFLNLHHRARELSRGNVIVPVSRRGY